MKLRFYKKNEIIFLINQLYPLNLISTFSPFLTL